MDNDLNNPQPDSPNLLSCVLILEEPKLPDYDLIALKCFKKHDFKLDGQLGSDEWGFVIDGTRGYIRLLHERFDVKFIERASLTSTDWPSAPADCAKNQSHIFITTIPDRNMSKYTAHCQLTDFACAVIEEVKAIGVCWPGAPKIIKVNDFLEMAKDSIYRISCWVEFVPTSDSEAVRVRTIGMDQFGLMEMEFESKKGNLVDLMRTAVTLSSHLANAGQVIIGGQTIPGPANEVIKVQEKVSDHNPKERVLCFSM